ncbi:molybdopterin-dependent oxidoreductase [bacterium]|nr:molybdopterin-dependent oxidoreductase [bacterium]
MSLASYPLVSDWISLNDGRLTVRTGKVDIGQRITTALVQIAHEELTVPFDEIEVETLRTDCGLNEGMTSGSNSLEQSGHALRCATATLRVWLASRAASLHGGKAEDWQISGGDLHLPATNHKISVVDLMGTAVCDVKVDPDAQPRVLEDTSAPKPAMRGLRDMVQGQFAYIYDLDVPGLQHARLVRPPHAYASLVEIPKTARQKLDVAGLKLIQDGSFIAVLGPQEWPVVKVAERLAALCVWDEGGGLPETDVFAHLVAKNAQSFRVIDGKPTEEPLPDAVDAPDFSACFERPYQLHGSMAPSAAMAIWQDDVLTIHSQSQGIYILRDSIVDSLGLDPEQVDITHVHGAGCYGHTGADDASFDAALIAMARPSEPILLKWTRAQEHAWEPFAPAMAVNVAAKTASGQINVYAADVFSDTHGGRPRMGANRAGPARLLSNRYRADPVGAYVPVPAMGKQAGIHRNLEPVYNFPDTRLTKNLVKGLPHRTSALRCLGGAANIFALESFMDELAEREGIDAFALRRGYLTDARCLAVLDELERQVLDLPENDGRGIAYAQYKNSMTRVGICVDIDVSDLAEILLKRVTIVADAGRVIDVDGVTAQLEGGVVQAASWALYEQVQWDRDGIISRDWDSYPVIRFDNIPKFNVTVLHQPSEKSVGAGEASPGPTIAAIANAIFDATGIRMRRMPFTTEAIRETALNA